MGNPIQYRNTDNPSQIQGWVSHNKGGFIKRLQYALGGGANHNAFIVMVRSPGAYPGRLMKTFHRQKRISFENGYKTSFSSEIVFTFSWCEHGF